MGRDRLSEKLREQVMHGLRWMAIARIASQAFTWLATLWVIRLLSPADYGLMSLATIFISFFSLFSELGLTPAIVQAKNLNEEQLRDVFGVILLFTAMVIGLLYCGAHFIGRFFDEPALVPVVKLLSLQFGFSGLIVLPEALLQRKMHFRGWSLCNLSAGILSSLATLLMAWLGYGVWSLVWGNLVNFGTQALVLNLLVRFIPVPRMQIGKIISLIKFGGMVSVTRVLSFVYQNADFFIVGKLLGKDLLGFYSVAFNLAQMPMSRAFGILNRVAFPAFSKIQSDPDLGGRQYLKALRLVSLFGVPVAWGMASVAPNAVPLILGRQWVDAILPFQLICLVIPLRIASTLLPPMLQGFGRVEISFMNVVRSTVVMAISFLIGSKWGIVGVSLAWVTAWPAVFMLNLRHSLPVIKLTHIDMFTAISRPWSAGAIMLAATVAFRLVGGRDFPDLYALVITILIGVFTYVLATLTLNRQGTRETLELIRSRS